MKRIAEPDVALTSIADGEHLRDDDLLPLLADFYITSSLWENTEAITYHRELTVTLAERLLRYVIMACGGEARHWHGRDVRGVIRELSPAARIMFALTGDGLTPTRDAVWRQALLARRHIADIQMLSGLAEIFHLHWGERTGIGGVKWAEVAEAGLMFANGTLTPGMFIDYLIDLVHNGGWALNKTFATIHSCGVHSINFKEFLELKREASIEEFASQVCISDKVFAFLGEEKQQYVRDETTVRFYKRYKRNTDPRDISALHGRPKHIEIIWQHLISEYDTRVPQRKRPYLPF